MWRYDGKVEKVSIVHAKDVIPMGNIINLNQFRKRRARDEKARKASENRTRHGRTKDQREAESRDVEAAKKELEAKRIERGEHPPDGGSNPTVG